MTVLQVYRDDGPLAGWIVRRRAGSPVAHPLAWLGPPLVRLAEYGGLKKVMPRLVGAFLIVTLSSIGLPGLNGFVGEFLILLGAFAWDPRFAAIAATGIVLSATYMLWMFQRVKYGPVTNDKNASLPDLRPREWVQLVPIIVLAVLMGVLPNLFLRPMAPAVERLIDLVRSEAPSQIRAELR